MYLEVDFVSLTVSDATFIEDLEQNHRDILMSLFEFVEQNHS
jgi:hypothetical protein